MQSKCAHKENLNSFKLVTLLCDFPFSAINVKWTIRNSQLNAAIDTRTMNSTLITDSVLVRIISHHILLLTVGDHFHTHIHISPITNQSIPVESKIYKLNIIIGVWVCTVPLAAAVAAITIAKKIKETTKTTMKMTIIIIIYRKNQCCVKIECKRAKHFETIHRWTQQINFETNKIYTNRIERRTRFKTNKHKIFSLFSFLRSALFGSVKRLPFYLCAIVVYPKGENSLNSHVFRFALHLFHIFR